MKRKLLIIFLSICAVVCLTFGISACGGNSENSGTNSSSSQSSYEESSPEEEPSESLAYSLNSDGNSYNVCGIGEVTSSAIEIPATHEGLPVTGIEDYAFGECDSLTSVTIPDSVTYIGNGAFYGTSLISITIPDSVTSIGGSIFSNCVSLESVTMGSGITSIENWMFEGCVSLKSIIIPDNVTSIGGSAFEECTSLESVTIGESVSSIGAEAFYNCTALTELNFNATAMEDLSSKYLENFVFYCAGQSGDGITVNIGSNVTKIPAYLFYERDNFSSDYAPKITGVVFEEGSVCASIGDYAFYGSDSLTSIIIPDSVETIGNYAFCAPSLTSLTIGKGVKTIGSSAFSCDYVVEIVYNATAIDELISGIFQNIGRYGGGITLTIGANVTKLPVNMFRGQYYTTSYPAANITSIIFEEGSVCESIGDYAFYSCTELASVSIPDGVETIGEYAFYNCALLENLSIGSGVKTIGDYAFFSCDLIESINLTDGAESIGDYAFASNSGLTSVVIPDSITYIGDYSFVSCSALASVSIGSGKKTVGMYAFHQCVSIESINFAGATSIGEQAVSNCNLLESVTMSDGLTSVGSSAFFGCTSLTSVYFDGTASQWASISFDNSSATPLYYGSLYLKDENSEIGYSVAANITIDNIDTIGTYAFYLCRTLESVTIGNSVISIGKYAFFSCNMTSLRLGSSIESIGEYAFCYCNMTSLSLECNVESIGEYAFYNCNYVTQINYNIPALADLSSDNNVMFMGQYGDGITLTIGTDATKIPSYLFNNCRITNIVFEESGVCSSINDYAFYSIGMLESVTIPDSVTYIGNYAFNECTKLANISIGNGIKSIGQYAFRNTSYYNNTDNWTDNVLYIGTYLISISYLESCTINSGTTVIADYAFYNGSWLTSVTIPDSVIYIGNYAFSNCTALTSVTIPDSVISIGYWTFSGCSKLASVSLGSNVTSIGDYAFSWCTKLGIVTIPAKVTSIGYRAFYMHGSSLSVTFANTSGWYITETSNSENGTDIDVSNASTNATNIGTTYTDYYWYRSEN